MLEVRALRVASIGILVASVAACTAQDRYDAVYRDNVRVCDLKVSEAERERCREQLAPATYEEYERQRARVLKSLQPGEREGLAPRKKEPSARGARGARPSQERPGRTVSGAGSALTG